MACHERCESRRIRRRAIAPPGDVEVRTKQHIVSLVNFTRMRHTAHVEPLEGTSERMKGFLRIPTKSPGYNGIMAPGIPE